MEEHKLPGILKTDVAILWRKHTGNCPIFVTSQNICLQLYIKFHSAVKVVIMHMASISYKHNCALGTFVKSQNVIYKSLDIYDIVYAFQSALFCNTRDSYSK